MTDRISFGDIAQDGVEAVWNNQEYTAFREQPDFPVPPEVRRSCALYAGTF